MTQRTTNQTMSGATLAISASLPATYDAAGYGATAVVYTEVGQVVDYGSHGVQAQVNTLTAVKDATVQKFKGSLDFGKKSVILGNLPSDAGQVIVHAAKTSQNRYSLKVTYPLGQGETTPEIDYLEVLVTKAEKADGDVNNVRKLNVDYDICRAPVTVNAT